MSFDKSGNLWVTDGNNARVLEYVPPFSSGMTASVVLGQQNFEGMHTGTSSNMLSEPYDVKVDGKGDLWIADTDNNRVLEFAASSAHETSVKTVPEFGSLAMLVLVFSLGGIMLLSRRRLGFA